MATAAKSNYLKAVEAAEKRKVRLTLNQQQEIRDIYTEIAYDLSLKIKKTNPNAVTYTWLNSYKDSLLKDIEGLNKQLNARIRANMRKAAEYGSSPQLSMFEDAALLYGFGKGKFDVVFATIPDDVVTKILSGKLYQDKRALSARIWSATEQNSKDIEHIIARGIAAKKSAYDLAKDLETYVNPSAKKDWEWSKVYPHCGNKSIDYNAQRLARTSIQHAYQQAQKQSCKRNPYVEGIRWLASGHARTCSLCRERSEQDAYGLGAGVYPVSDVPMDHANGRCSTIPVVTQSLEDIGREIGDWLGGGSNPKLDKWWQQYGE